MSKLNGKTPPEPKPVTETTDIPREFLMGALFGLSTRAAASLKDIFVLMHSNEYQAAPIEGVETNGLRAMIEDITRFATEVYQQGTGSSALEKFEIPLDAEPN